MKGTRFYGDPPYRVAVIHGGPGAAGELAPLAEELAKRRGVIEPLLRGLTIEQQLQELARALPEPATLIGHSWGAMLSVLFAARFPSQVAKLILVSSGVFDEAYASQILRTRLDRLDPALYAEAEELIAHAEDFDAVERLALIFEQSDTYSALPHERPPMEFDAHVYRAVWGEARDLRASGELLRLGGRIRCPVVAIHGDYDPHPAEGVREPLAQIIADFRFVLLPRCGHKPWIERYAHEPFFALLEEELKST